MSKKFQCQILSTSTTDESNCLCYIGNGCVCKKILIVYVKKQLSFVNFPIIGF